MCSAPIKKPMKGIINSYFPSLTKSEQKVAAFVLNHLDQVMYYAVTDLADQVGVGETTVLRFCRKINFKGYQEFKLAIAQNLAEENEEDEATGASNLKQSISANAIQTINYAASMISDTDLKQAIEMLDKAPSIHFFGVGTSGLTALDAKSRFLRIGRRTEAIVDPHLQAMTAATLGKDDVAIGISITGSTRDTIQSLEIAKENGANIIVITYYSRSPITRLADIVLNGGEKESPLESGSFAGKVSQLFVVELLCSGIDLLRKEHSLNRKKKIANAVVNKIY